MIFYRVFDPQDEDHRSHYHTRLDYAQTHARQIARENGDPVEVQRVTVAPELTPRAALLLALNQQGIFSTQVRVFTAWPRVDRERPEDDQ